MIDAMARARVVARHVGMRAVHIDRLVGWHGLLERGEALSLETVIRSAPTRWWYGVPLPNRQAAICYMTDFSGHSRRWLANALESADARAIFAAFGADRSIWLPTPHACGTSFLAMAGGEDWLAVGDAALALDPMSSQGIEFALQCTRYTLRRS